jgi:hypothetical protein
LRNTGPLLVAALGGLLEGLPPAPEAPQSVSEEKDVSET